MEENSRDKNEASLTPRLNGTETEGIGNAKARIADSEGSEEV